MKTIIIEAVQVTKRKIEVHITEDGLTESQAEKLLSIDGATIPSESSDFDFIQSLFDLDEERMEKSCLFDVRVSRPKD